MKAILSFSIECSSLQKAAALRDGAASYLAANDAQILSSSMGKQTCPYRVVGVDTSNKKPFRERVEAVDEQEAAVLSVGGSKSKVVADVNREAA